VSLLFASICYFLITRLTFFKYSFYVWFLYCIFVFYLVYPVFFLLLWVLCLFLCCLFSIFIQDYRPLPPAGNTIAVNKYHHHRRHYSRFHETKAANGDWCGRKKQKAVPLQAWSGPEGSRKLRFPYLMKTAEDGGKVVSLTRRPPLPTRNTPGTHFC